MSPSLLDWSLFAVYGAISLTLYVLCFTFVVSMWKERGKKAVSLRMPQLIAFNFYWASLCLFNSWLSIYISLGLENRILDVISQWITNFWVLYLSMSVTVMMWRHVWHYLICRFETELTWKSQLRISVKRPWLNLFSPLLQLWKSVVITCLVTTTLISISVYVFLYLQFNNPDRRDNLARLFHDGISMICLTTIVKTLRMRTLVPGSINDCYGVRREMLVYLTGLLLWLIWDIGFGLGFSQSSFHFRLATHLKNSMLSSGYFYVSCSLSVRSSTVIRQTQKRKVIIRSNNNVEMRMKSKELLKQVLHSYASFSLFTEHCVSEMNVESVLFVVWYMRAKQMLFVFLRDNDMFDYDQCKDFFESVNLRRQRSSIPPPNHPTVIGAGYAAGDDDTSSESLGRDFRKSSYYRRMKALSPDGGFVGGMTRYFRTREPIQKLKQTSVDNLSESRIPPQSPEEQILLQDIVAFEQDGLNYSPSKNEYSMSSLSSKINKLYKRSKSASKSHRSLKPGTARRSTHHQSFHRSTHSDEGSIMMRNSRGHERRHKLFHGEGRLGLHAGDLLSSHSGTLALPAVFPNDSTDLSINVDNSSPLSTVRSIEEVKLESTTTEVLLKPAAEVTIESMLTNPIPSALKLGLSSNSSKSDDEDQGSSDADCSGRDVEDFTLGLQEQLALQAEGLCHEISPPIVLSSTTDTYDSSGPNDLVVVCENEELDMSETIDQTVRHPSLATNSDGGTSTDETSSMIHTPPPDPYPREVTLTAAASITKSVQPSGVLTLSHRNQSSENDRQMTIPIEKPTHRMIMSSDVDPKMGDDYIDQHSSTLPINKPGLVVKSSSTNDIDKLKQNGITKPSKKPGLWTLLESMKFQSDARSKLRDSPSPPMVGLLFSTSSKLADPHPRRRYFHELGTIVQLPRELLQNMQVLSLMNHDHNTSAPLKTRMKSASLGSEDEIRKSKGLNHNKTSYSNSGNSSSLALELVASRFLNLLNDFVGMDGPNSLNVGNDCRSNALQYRQRLQAIGGDLTGDPIFQPIAQSMSIGKKVKVLLRCIVCLDAVLSEVMRVLQNDAFQRFIDTMEFQSWAASDKGPFKHQRRKPLLKGNASM